MQMDPQGRNGNTEPSYLNLLKELGDSTKELVRSEIELFTTELKQTAPDIAKHTMQTAGFGALLGVSIFPFLAFLVIGLGQLLDGRYWLSSLIVAVVCAAVGGTMAYRAAKKLTEKDFRFNRTRSSLGINAERVQQKVEDVKDAAVQGDRHESNQLH